VQKAASRAGGETVLSSDEAENELTSWSPDQQYIMYQRRTGGSTGSPWVLPLAGNRKPFPFSQPRAFFPRFSRNGRWVVYSAQESDRPEVFVAAFPGPGSKTQISVAGGNDAMWSADDKEIIYYSVFTHQMMLAAVNVGSDHIDVVEVKPLFDFTKVGSRTTFDVSADGQRILALTPRAPTTSDPVTLIVNWPALVKK
jgi:Tol biopolymer transport system component